jgi:hypothetical protein
LELPEETGDLLGYEPQWSAISINYDLVTALLEKSSTVDPDDVVGLPNMISPAAATAIYGLEARLDAQLRQRGLSQRLLDADFLEKAFSDLRSEVPAFREQVTSAKSGFRKEDLGAMMERNGLLWFNHRFAFMGAMPGSLSAYESLNDLCTQLRNPA